MKPLALALILSLACCGAERPKAPAKLHAAFELTALVASGVLDARSTNELHKRFSRPGFWFREANPAVRPFVGSLSIYLAIPAGDMAIYCGLRYVLRKPRAAKWFVRGETAENLYCVWNNDRQKPQR